MSVVATPLSVAAIGRFTVPPSGVVCGPGLVTTMLFCTIQVKIAEAAAACWSVAVTVTWPFAAAVAVPVIAPVVALIASPAGSPVALYANGSPVPSVSAAVIGRLTAEPIGLVVCVPGLVTVTGETTAPAGIMMAAIAPPESRMLAATASSRARPALMDLRIRSPVLDTSEQRQTDQAYSIVT